MRIGFRHATSYHFDRPVPYALQRLRLKPKDSAMQKVAHWRMDIEGGVCEAEYDDAHLNHVALIRVTEGAESIRVVCTGEVETDPDFHGIVGPHRGHIPLWLFRQPTALTRPGPEIAAITARAKSQGHGDAIALLHDLSAIVASAVVYATGVTDAATSAEEAARAGRGVCQDHAQIFMAAARALGFPARYVGGYLFVDDKVDQEAGHAWAEAHIDGLGWVGFDVSNGISPDHRYVRVATGRDYADAAPIHAMSFGASDATMLVSLRVDQ